MPVTTCWPGGNPGGTYPGNPDDTQQRNWLATWLSYVTPFPQYVRSVRAQRRR